MKKKNRRKSFTLLLGAISWFALRLMSFGQTAPSYEFADANESHQPQTTFTVLYSFYDENDGRFPEASLLINKYGALYGTASSGGATCCGTVFVQAGIYHITIHSFSGQPDGNEPLAGLVMDSSGNLYGTTFFGGTGQCASGCGTIFKVDTKFHYSVLYSFTNSGGDGAYPKGDLVIDRSGNLYGTTVAGGDLNCHQGDGCGIVFKLTTNNKEHVLYKFAGAPDGYYPIGSLALDSSGNLYGATLYGGNVCGGLGCGTIFKLDSHNNETVVHRFSGSDGEQPAGGVVRDSSGTLYGTTNVGGTSGFGTVFAVSHGQESVLYNFTNGSDGSYPQGGVHVDMNGNIYGTTVAGGYGKGVVFRLDKNYNFSVLHRFNVSDGYDPFGGIVQDAAGALYGTNYFGGANGFGTMFKLTN